MENDRLFQKWKTISEDDLRMAQLAHTNGMFLHAAYNCQQAVEKILKGYILLFTNQDPPYTHDLVRLYRVVPQVTISLGFAESVYANLTAFYLGTRYPSHRDGIAKNLSSKTVEEYLNLAKELIAWVDKNKKS
jgi:HEPN domain-containing protein